MPPAAIAIGGAALGGAILGGAGGAMSKKSRQSNTSGVNLNPVTQGGFEEGFYGTQTPNFDAKQQQDYDRWINISNDSSASAEDRAWAQKQAQQMAQNPSLGFSAKGGMGQDILKTLGNYTNAGPGQSDVQNAYGANKDLASMFGDYAKTGGIPGQEDINAANGFANNMYAARQVGLNQSFVDQTTDANRLAARLGRSVDDPILQAKLRTGFMRQQDSLSAEKQGTAQQFALQLPQQRLQYAQGQAGVLNGLSAQAMQNQSFLLGIGNQLAQQEQNFRFQTSDRFQNSNSSSGGGLGGAMAGALGGAGAGLQIGSSINSLMASPSFMGGGLGGAAGSAGGGFGLNTPSYGFQAPQAVQPNYGSGSVFNSSPFNPFGR